MRGITSWPARPKCFANSRVWCCCLPRRGPDISRSTELRDPEAEGEASILAQAGLPPHNSSVTFTPYLSTEPTLIQKRARRILIPQSSVVLSFQETDGVLLATGIAATSWIDDAEKMARLIPGVRRFDCQVRAEKRPKSLYQVLYEKSQELESIEFRFRAGSIELIPGQEAQLERAVSTMKELVKLVETDTSGMNVTIEVHAHTDPLGSELYNLKLRESRAKMMRHWFANAGVDMRRLKAVAPLEFEQENQSVRRPSVLSSRVVWEPRDSFPCCKKVCMLGAYAVGKTSLVRRFVHSMFTDKYLTTVGVKIDKRQVQHNGKEVTLLLWDLYGEDEFQRVQTSYLRGSSGLLIVADGTRLSTLDKGDRAA